MVMREKEEKNKVEKGVLYLVATPIGNLSDITERALKVLSEADLIAAEDTRNSAKLLSVYGISKPMLSYHQHNRAERGPIICDKLEAGETVALVTDAGCPAVSDPGEDLVRLCAERGIKVTFIPGACAAITALALSGLSTVRFAFEGFVGGTKSERKQRFTALSGDDRTLIFYEAPHRLRTTLSEMLEAFGDRHITLCRELTKLNEEIIRTTLKSAVNLYESTEPRGEYVLILEGNASPASEQTFWAEMTVREHVEHYISLGQDKNTAIKSAAKDRGVHKSEIYKQVL